MKKMLKSSLRTAIAAAAFAAVSHAQAAGVYITEWMYQGAIGEFVEFTNLSGASIDFTGWSFDDDSRIPGVLSLSAFGVVANGESVIITETSAAAFRSEWNLSSSVKVIGGYTNNLGRKDEINLFNNSGQLVDRLTYGDQDFPGSPRTTSIAGEPLSLAALGANNAALWTYAALGDATGSYYSASGDLGSPGKISAVPVPAAAWLFGSALVGMLGLKRRKA